MPINDSHRDPGPSEKPIPRAAMIVANAFMVGVVILVLVVIAWIVAALITYWPTSLTC